MYKRQGLAETEEVEIPGRLISTTRRWGLDEVFDFHASSISRGGAGWNHAPGHAVGRLRFLRRHSKPIIDRDANFSASFRKVLARAGVGAVLIPARAPNCNAYAERFVRSIKEECLGKMIFFGETSLHPAIREFVEQLNLERPHQGIGNELIEPAKGLRTTSVQNVVHDERLGGLQGPYRVSAA